MDKSDIYFWVWVILMVGLVALLIAYLIAEYQERRKDE